ncbi:alpha-ketoacid dehydrogenase subunit beta [Pasteuria penetrans]|uniref:alpha-ketoacid dehydrogenase subunit beta n=1 Tax=Pasteuria penetrans TaxID=86005 RepID=UPI000FB5AF08|nr:alpha-ketoacid dehydrogenase subunit beta [Pasteuria penetrans]
MAQLTMVKALNDALRIALATDPSVLLLGEDVGKNGGVFRVSENLQGEFGEERVFDTPLAESGIGGMAVGLGVQGFRAVAEIQFIGFIFEAMDSIMVQAPRMRYRSGGRYSCPIVFRAPFGAGVKPPELHGDSLEGLLVQSPGLKVVCPSNPYDAKGLLLAAIRDPDPVFFLEHLKLYFSKSEVKEGDYTIPLGQAAVVREGVDVTLISYGAMVRTAMAAAEKLAEGGTEAEVIDLRTLAPLDLETILASVEKTGRAVVVQEAQRQAGVAASIVAEIQESAILSLRAPVLRVTSPDTVLAFPLIEEQWLPSVGRVIQAVEQSINF